MENSLALESLPEYWCSLKHDVPLLLMRYENFHRAKSMDTVAPLSITYAKLLQRSITSNYDEAISFACGMFMPFILCHTSRTNICSCTSMLGNHSGYTYFCPVARFQNPICLSETSDEPAFHNTDEYLSTEQTAALQVQDPSRNKSPYW